MPRKPKTTKRELVYAGSLHHEGGFVHAYYFVTERGELEERVQLYPQALGDFPPGAVCEYGVQTNGAVVTEGATFTRMWPEVAAVHETPTDFLREALYANGIFYFTWIVFGITFFAIMVTLYFRFWLALESRARLGFLAAAIVFVGGAIGVESLGGRYAGLHGMQNIKYAFFYTLEEFLEMAGVVIFAGTLLGYIDRHVKPQQQLSHDAAA